MVELFSGRGGGVLDGLFVVLIGLFVGRGLRLVVRIDGGIRRRHVVGALDLDFA